MALPIIIAKNVAGIDLLIDDMGILLLSGTSRTLSDNFTEVDICESINLYNYVSDGQITLNNGTRDLTIAEGLEFLNLVSELDNKTLLVGSADSQQFIFDSDGNNTARTRVTSSGYVMIARYIFRGSYNGTIPYFKMIAATKNASGNCYIQLIDVTHSNTQVFEKLVLGLNPLIYTVSDVTGVASTESIFELKGKATSSNELFIYSFLTQFA